MISLYINISKSISMLTSLDNAPLLDALLKESAYLHPSDSISIRRKVLKPFKFSDGTHILPGDVACVPSQAIMRDEQIYSNQTVFWPERYLTLDVDGRAAQWFPVRVPKSVFSRNYGVSVQRFKLIGMDSIPGLSPDHHSLCWRRRFCHWPIWASVLRQKRHLQPLKSHGERWADL